MAETDWTFMADGLDSSAVKRGVTLGPTKPNGGGSYVFGCNSQVVTAGAVGLFYNAAGFAPAASGWSIRGAMKRGVSGSPTGFSPMLFAGAQSNSVNGSAYLLGLDDDDPHSITLVKAAIVGGVPSAAPPTLGVLARGTETFLNDTWLHLRLDMIVNVNGDVILQAFRNDLTANPVTAPVWTAVPGLVQFIDDALGVNSGSAPLTSGYAGFAFATKDVTRRAFFDYIEAQRQTS